MGYELILAGMLENVSYASAGYFKNKAEKGDKSPFDWKNWLRTVLTGAIPPVIVTVLGFFQITLPAGFEIVNFLGPALDKLLRIWL